MLEKIKSSKEQFIAEIRASKTAEEVENIRIKYLSKKGEITALFGGLKDLVLDVKKEAGNLLNTFRDEAYELLNSRKESFENENKTKIDLTLPGRKINAGKLHPVLVIRDEIKRILMQPKEVALVKMADRVANLSNPQLCWTIEKKQYYLKEASFILDKLAFSGKKMAQQLENAMKNYENKVYQVINKVENKVVLSW